MPIRSARPAECTGDESCPAGEHCVDGFCEPRPSSGPSKKQLLAGGLAVAAGYLYVRDR